MATGQDCSHSPSLPARQDGDAAGGLHAAKGVGGAHDVLPLVQRHGLRDLHRVQRAHKHDAVTLPVHQAAVALVPGNCQTDEGGL